MSASMTEAIAVGLTPLPQNRPKSLTIEYEAGSTIVLKGQSLRRFWEEFVQMWIVVQNLEAAQEHAAKMGDTPIFSADSLRQVHEAAQKNMPKLPNNEE